MALRPRTAAGWHVRCDCRLSRTAIAMVIIGFLMAWFFFRRSRSWVAGDGRSYMTWHDSCDGHGGWGCGHHWDRRSRHAERRAARAARRARRRERWRSSAPEPSRPPEEDALRRARRRAAVEAGFYAHLASYLGVIAFLAFINLLTTRYPWFLWPALGLGIALFSHWMAVFGSRILREHFYEPAVERELRRERASRAGGETPSPASTAEGLVHHMGEDATSVENVGYAKSALDELDRVERRVSHLLRQAEEERCELQRVNLATVVDAALAQRRASLAAARVAVSRHYIGGPTVEADAAKLRQVLTGLIDDAVDGFGAVAEGRRLDLFLDNGGGQATVRLRDNGGGIAGDAVAGIPDARTKRIVEAHHGSIDVASQVGSGTEFRITLPLPS
jgi:signal transduction histidine kinase